jgi:hypothetical protein
MGPLAGQWWKLADDDLVGRPYPTVASRHPGIYEGVDLLMASTISSHFLGVVANYHALILLTLMVNGWVAAWIIVRVTHSYGWAALGVVLITLNMSTNARLSGHMTLFKYGWVLLAVWAFFRYLDAPSWKRGLCLGLAGALVLASSFYYGFFLLLALGVWWLGCLVAGQLTLRHLLPTVVAGLTCVVVGALVTFPVWMNSSHVQANAAPGAENYFQRNRGDIWTYAAEPWQYLVSPAWPIADELVPLRPGMVNGDQELAEGWQYPGLVVLLGIGIYGVARLRGWRLGQADPKFVDRALGISAVLVLLSLYGGPGVLIYEWVPFFRSYGRAGLLALALWCVAIPVVLYSLAQRLTWRPLRAGLLLAAIALALYEGDKHRTMIFANGWKLPNPQWVNWLARQPPEVRLIALPIERDNYVNFYYRLVHNHATLNGCDLELLQLDLNQRGASLDRMTPEGLRFLVTLGYNTLAFDRYYLEANPDLAALPWLERVDEAGTWEMYRVNAAVLQSMPVPPRLVEASVPRTREADRPADPSRVAGSFDAVQGDRLCGWGWDSQQPDRPIRIDILEGGELLATILADEYRGDLRAFGGGRHAFSYTCPPQLKDGKEHTIHVRISGTNVEVEGSPKTIRFPR